MTATLTGGCLCGAIRYTVDVPITELRAGSLDDGAANAKIVSHIWTKSARPWSYIDPAAKQHPGQPDAPTAKA
jgi:hypothetical protein